MAGLEICQYLRGTTDTKSFIRHIVLYLFQMLKNATSLIRRSQALWHLYETIRKRKFEIPRWPSELQANQCRPVSPQRQIGRHELAGNSEGHRGIMIFFVKFVFYYWFCPNKSQFVEVAFFYHLKSQSYIVDCVSRYGTYKRVKITYFLDKNCPTLQSYSKIMRLLIQGLAERDHLESLLLFSAGILNQA